MDWKRRRTLPGAPVRRLAILGGTHGNESNGVHLAKHFLRHPDSVKRASFETVVLLANLGAISQNTRYVDEDLNRCYLLSDLADDALATKTSERKRAREVDATLGPKSSPEPRCDFVLDLHNTTSACGIALLMAPDDDFSHELGYRLMLASDKVRVVNWNKQADWPLCPSIGRSGMTFEVGPCSWGCIVPDLFAESLRLVSTMLDCIDAHNTALVQGLTQLSEVTMPVFSNIGVSIDYPRNADGELIGMIHPSLQGRDFQELKDGDALFLLFSGDVVHFRREDYPEAGTALYGIFINEAAYYEKKVALSLVRREEVQVRLRMHK